MRYQDLEGVVPCTDGFELEAVLILVVVVQKRIEDLSFVEELFEDQSLPSLKMVMHTRRSTESKALACMRRSPGGIHGGFAIKVMAFN